MHLTLVGRLLAGPGLGTLGTEPRVVHAKGRILNDNLVESPFTGLRAAAFSWRLVTREEKRAFYWELPPASTVVGQEVFREIASAVRGADLLLATRWGELLVGIGGLKIVSPHTTQGVVPLDRVPPMPELAAAFESAEHAVSIQEVSLRKGDPVRVIGFAERAGDAADHDPYRTLAARTPRFRTRGDLGRVELVDLTAAER